MLVVLRVAKHVTRRQESVTADHMLLEHFATGIPRIRILILKLYDDVHIKY